MRILLFGDSHMGALGPRLKELLDPQGIDVVAFYANSGKSTKWYAERAIVEDAVAQHRPDAVVFELSGNDWCWRADIAREYADELFRQAGGTKVVWVGPPSAARQDVDERHICSTRANREAARAHGAQFIDLRPITPESGHASDLVHFTRGGYDQMASDLAIELSEALYRPRGGFWPILGATALVLVAGGIFYATMRGGA